MSYFGLSHPRNVPTIMALVRQLAPSRVVDIGCGGGNYGKYLRDAFPALHITGIDAYGDNRNALWECYDEVIVADARTCELPPADLYLMVDVIEHMSRDDGFALISRLTAPVIICTPRHWPQAADENPYTEHVSEWHEDDFGFWIDRSDAEFVIGVRR